MCEQLLPAETGERFRSGLGSGAQKHGGAGAVHGKAEQPPPLGELRGGNAVLQKERFEKGVARAVHLREPPPLLETFQHDLHQPLDHRAEYRNIRRIARNTDHTLHAPVEHNREIDAALHAVRRIVLPYRKRVETVFYEPPRPFVYGADARLVCAREDHAVILYDVDVVADRPLHFRYDAHGVLWGKIHGAKPPFYKN